MKRVYAFQTAPRCTATSKRTRKPCQAPAVREWAVCRFHGARGGAPKGKANGAYRHGLYTVEAIEERRWLRELLAYQLPSRLAVSHYAALEPAPRFPSAK